MNVLDYILMYAGIRGFNDEVEAPKIIAEAESNGYKLSDETIKKIMQYIGDNTCKITLSNKNGGPDIFVGTILDIFSAENASEYLKFGVHTILDPNYPDVTLLVSKVGVSWSS